ncbi:MAG: pentapeptide repeat-containing protein [Acidobacteriota bacterium]|nr:pentapeptide repeat-containing protein [Acidobacteriota bacterium]
MVSCFCSVPAQVPKSSPTPLSTESRTETQKARDEAETEYFRAQTAKLKEPSVQGFTSNIPAVAAVFAGFVALVSFLFNYSANIKNQRDTQFYEALKRFGDKDSARLRSSAAGILTRIALNRGGVFTSHRPYFQTTLDQLVTGMMLEEEPVVLAAIDSALTQLFRVGKSAGLHRMKEINATLTKNCVSRLAEFFACTGTSEASDISDSIWDQAARITDYEDVILHDMGAFRGAASRLHRSDVSLEAEMRRVASAFQVLPNDQKPQHILNCIRALEISATRLTRSITLYGVALSSIIPKHPLDKFDAVWHSDLFLPRLFLNRMNVQKVTFENCSLQKMNFISQSNPGGSFAGSSLYGGIFHSSNLRQADLSGANLTRADFTQANLEGASLIHSQLRGTILRRANLSSTKLASVYIDDETDLSDAKWWEADFTFNDDVDSALFEKLWKRYSKDVPDDLGSVHSSITSLVSSKRNSK